MLSSCSSLFLSSDMGSRASVEAFCFVGFGVRCLLLLVRVRWAEEYFCLIRSFCFGGCSGCSDCSWFSMIMGWLWLICLWGSAPEFAEFNPESEAVLVARNSWSPPSDSDLAKLANYGSICFLEQLDCVPACSWAMQFLKPFSRRCPTVFLSKRPIYSYCDAT